VKEVESLAALRGQTIFVDIEDKITTHFDKERLYDVIINLLSNAIKNTPPEGEITIFTEQKDNSIVVSVKDSGVGITEEEKKKLFKKFGKIERYGQSWDINIEGTGLGLYIAKKIVRLHGGNIWVQSEGRNKGSTFSFSIPKT
jgi:signal transduction histidine kinase